MGYKIQLERATMLVCERCARGRHVVSVVNFSASARAQPKKPARMLGRGPKLSPEEDYVVVEGYGELVRRARERMGLTREALAALIGEKESTIRRVEAEQLEPSLDLARKLERALKIKLLERAGEWAAGESSTPGGGDYTLTLGDVAEFRE